MRAEVGSGTVPAGHGVAPTCSFCDSEVVTTAQGSDSPLSTSAPAGYGPADLAAAYHLPPRQIGRRGTIAILDAGYYPKPESDLAVAAPPDTFTKVVTGSNAQPCPTPVALCQAGPGWDGPTGLGTPNGLHGF